MEWEKIFANHISEKELISRIHTHTHTHIPTTEQQKSTQFKNGQKSRIDIYLPKEDTEWPQNTHNKIANTTKH